MSQNQPVAWQPPDPAVIVALQERLRQLEQRPSGGAHTSQNGPHIVLTTVDAYAHCGVPTCKGNRQEPVKAVHELAQWTFGMNNPGEKGPLANMVEREHTSLKFADPADAACPECGIGRQLTDQLRPTYERISGYSQQGLLKLRAQGITFDAEKQRELQAGPSESPEDRLKMLFVEGKMDAGEYRERRAVLEETSVPGPEGTELPPNVRAHGAGFQAYARVNGRQRQETFPTVDEAAAQVAEWKAA